MPVHDWTLVDSGLFHAFHQRWVCALCDALNAGPLPSEYFALPEQNIRGPIPDVLTLSLTESYDDEEDQPSGPVAVLTAPPRTRLCKKTEALSYLTKTSRVTVRHRHGEVVAVLEVVSPGNKAAVAEFRSFVTKSADLISQGVHLLVIDLFPPGPRDPLGIGKAIWDEFNDEEFEQFPDKPLTLVSFDAGPIKALHMEPIAVGDVLPPMPLFLQPESYVYVPLEAAYEETWRVFPTPMKKLLT